MLKTLLSRIFGTVNDRHLKSFRWMVEATNALEPKYAPLSDAALKAQTNILKERLKNGETLDEILPDAFAVVREAAKRTLGQRHYDVQLVGGIVLHRGMISEMKTGEGKTLVSTLPAYLNALTGKGVHIVTPNDYLAQRDSEWVGVVHRFLGLSVGCITHDLSDDERRTAYGCDITYATNNELGFDYLRDNMRYSKSECVQAQFNFAIVDEIDSILIDEARTPLIISGPSEDRSELYYIADKFIYQLVQEDYEIDEKTKSSTLTDTGINKLEKLCERSNIITSGSSLYDIQNIAILHHITQGLRAHKLFKNNVDYIVKDKQVLIIDEFTGRTMEGRRYSDGIHQALEAKEKLVVQNENQTLASITFQNYFRLYPKLSGMTGTAATEAQEFHDIYNLQVVSIPTKNPVLRRDEEDVIYGTGKEKYDAIIKEIEAAYKKQQPILVGTVSIEKSEHISYILKKRKIKHNVLNAKHHAKEAQIIAQAGRLGAVTIATNMAGRGTDIMLGGNAQMLVKQTGKTVKEIEKQVEQEKEAVMKAGGLVVIGTERHESRRIDNQLRGRSGRMGDPGRSVFYLSLEDDLMRIFASDKIASILKTLGLKEGESIYHPLISRTIEKAQNKVEARNYEIRKNLLKFDDVMNDQRKVIFEQRTDIMSTERIEKIVLGMCHDFNGAMVHHYISQTKYREEWDIEELTKKLDFTYGQDFGVKEFLKKDGLHSNEITQFLDDGLEKFLTAKRKRFGRENFENAAKRILLLTLDHLWKEHLLTLDHLRHGIHLRAYGQKDPLNEYKREAFNYFSDMLERIKETYIQKISYVELQQKHIDERDIEDGRAKSFSESRVDPALLLSDEEKEQWVDVKRNDQCPCGSGKKFKHCHG